MRKRIKLLFLFVLFLGFSLQAQIQNRPVQNNPLKKSTIDDYNNYTTVGQIGLTVTNFGVLGEGWNNPDQPSCRYKQYPDIEQEEIEHFSYSGLWIGGEVNGQKRVSTAIVDGVFDYGAEGFEFSASTGFNDTISIKSSIETSKYFDPQAVSHQDFVCDYTDFNNIVNHKPMGIRVHQESYAWSYSFADAFVIMDYTIYNESNIIDANGVGWDIKNMFAGIWADASVANMNYTSKYDPGGGFTWYDNQDGFDQSIYDAYPDDEFYGLERDIAYQYDVDGDNGYAQSYVGFRVLGTDYVPRDYWDTYYRQWVWSTSSNTDYPEYVMPIDDSQRYDFMQKSVPYKPGESGYTSEGYPNAPDSWLFLLSAGPFGKHPDADSSNWVLKPGESVNIAFAIVCAPWANSTLSDSPARKAMLYANSDWAQTAYNGEDVNGNGYLEPSEDTDQDGIMDRYILPAPPPSPIVKIVSESGKATIYWGRKPEKAQDPLTQREDFEGYRLYGRSKTATNNEQWTLMGQFDILNDIGYNTDLSTIQLTREESKSEDEQGNTIYHYLVEDEDTLYFKIFDQDTMFYRFVNEGIHSGWPERNVYSVTSFDQGDPATGLESMESNKIDNMTYVIAGKKPQTENFDAEVGVYPNPYKARAVWDGFSEREKMIWFYNLPAKAKVTIFTLSGELVDKFTHDAATYKGSDIENLANIATDKNIVFSGGEHAWDLITKWDQAIATGLYLFTVENLESGKIQRGKFLVIK
ncbi:MAG: hypothetical protein JXQ65_01215 [Candidatus Marinimicrobia bacterium]|nr:hypothetical protein [Candidatus Neomarinimicrobiota bacterium]